MHSHTQQVQALAVISANMCWWKENKFTLTARTSISFDQCEYVLVGREYIYTHIKDKH